MQSVRRVGPATGGTLQHGALGPDGACRNCACPENPLVSGQGNEEVPAVAGVGFPVGTVEMRGRVAPSSAVAEQVAAEDLLALASLP